MTKESEEDNAVLYVDYDGDVEGEEAYKLKRAERRLAGVCLNCGNGSFKTNPAYHYSALESNRWRHCTLCRESTLT